MYFKRESLSDAAVFDSFLYYTSTLEFALGNLSNEMESLIFHLETISDEDLQEIVSLLNLSTSRSRTDLIGDILAYYVHVEGIEDDQNQTRTRTRSASRNGQRHSSEVLTAASRGMSRLDHPSCPGRSRYIDDDLPLEVASPRPSDPRISLRSVLQRWEEIGLLEEQGRSSGRSPRSSLGSSRRSSSRYSTSPRQSDLPRQADIGELNNIDSSPSAGTLMDYRFGPRSNESTNSPTTSTPSGHSMRLRDRHTETTGHSMALRQRRLPIPEVQNNRTTRTPAIPNGENDRRRAGGAINRTPRLPSTLTAGPSLNVGDLIDIPNTDFWNDVRSALNEENSLSEYEYWDVISISGEEEEEDDDFDEYGLDVQEIREHTVEGRFQERKKRKLIETAPDKPTTEEQPASQSEDNTSCPICLERFQQSERIRTLPCFHIYHVRCIDRWLKSNSKCPICKHSVV